MRPWQVWLAAVVAVAVAGLACWGVLHIRIDGSQPVGMKNLSGTVAEGFVYRAGKEKFPRATCDACRIGKMKMGVISLGAFNTVEFDNLIINLPPPSDDDPDSINERKMPDDGASSILSSFQLKPIVAMARVDAKKSFASVRINRLIVNRMAGEELELVFSADVLRTKGKKIGLQGVTLGRCGVVHKVQAAELLLKPRMKIVWPGGVWDITDVVEPRW